MDHDPIRADGRRPVRRGTAQGQGPVRRGHGGAAEEAADDRRPHRAGRMGRRHSNHRLPGPVRSRRRLDRRPPRHRLVRLHRRAIVHRHDQRVSARRQRAQLRQRPRQGLYLRRKHRDLARSQPRSSSAAAGRSAVLPVVGQRGRRHLRRGLRSETRARHRLERQLGVSQHGRPPAARVDHGAEPAVERPRLEAGRGRRQDAGRADRAELQGPLEPDHVVPGVRRVRRLVPLHRGETDGRRPQRADHLAGRAAA